MSEFEKRTLTATDLEAVEDLNGAEFYSCEIEGVAAEQLARGKKLKFFECRFNGCNLSNLDVTGYVFNESTFAGCKLVGINWTRCSKLVSPEFRDCKLDFSVFQQMPLRELKCHDCSAREVDFARATLTRAVFGGSLEGANFNGCDLSEADLRTATDYFIDPKLVKLKGARFSFPHAAVLLEALGVRVD